MNILSKPVNRGVGVWRSNVGAVPGSDRVSFCQRWLCTGSVLDRGNTAGLTSFLARGSRLVRPYESHNSHIGQSSLLPSFPILTPPICHRESYNKPVVAAMLTGSIQIFLFSFSKTVIRSLVQPIWNYLPTPLLLGLRPRFPPPTRHRRSTPRE